MECFPKPKHFQPSQIFLEPKTLPQKRWFMVAVEGSSLLEQNQITTPGIDCMLGFLSNIFVCHLCCKKVRCNTLGEYWLRKAICYDKSHLPAEQYATCAFTCLPVLVISRLLLCAINWQKSIQTVPGWAINFTRLFSFATNDHRTTVPGSLSVDAGC